MSGEKLETNDQKIEALLRHSTAEEQTIEKLIRLAGQREEIDPGCTERVRERVYQTWLRKQQQDQKSQESMTAQQRFFPRASQRVSGHRISRRAWFASAGLAASVLVGGLMFTDLSRFFQSKPAERDIVARVIALQGDATLGAATLAQASPIRAGEEVRTGNSGGVAVALANGSLVKIDRLTKVRFTNREDMELIAGAVYFDSQEKGNIRVHTSRGMASDIGTQFETRLSENELLVRVREGKVRVDQAQTAVYVASGQALQLTEGTARVTEIPADDEQWIWADSLDDNFSLANRSMAEILVWISRKEGWALRFQQEADQQRARQDIIRGRLSIGDSEEMLRQLSLISDMRFQLNDKTLLVSYPQ